jgi:hypothetical protein
MQKKTAEKNCYQHCEVTRPIGECGVGRSKSQWIEGIYKAKEGERIRRQLWDDENRELVKMG